MADLNVREIKTDKTNHEPNWKGAVGDRVLPQQKDRDRLCNQQIAFQVIASTTDKETNSAAY